MAEPRDEGPGATNSWHHLGLLLLQLIKSWAALFDQALTSASALECETGWAALFLNESTRPGPSAQPTTSRPGVAPCPLPTKTSSSKTDMSEIEDVSLEPVIEVNLQCQVSPSQYNRQTTVVSKGRISLQDRPRLKVGLLFMPHGSSEDLLPVNTSYAAEVIHGDKQHCLHTNITFQQLEDIILPKAVDYFDQNAEASIYKILWKSNHGTAYIQVEAASMKNQRRLGTNENQEQEYSRHVIPHFLELWVAHAPVWLQGSVVDWIQKSKDKELAPPPTLHLKF
ncbi:hypothetical protein U9M48_011511 [Paspalum notatum var. saurae]|uniref:Uncharacterized protein n=1 Tax=Paspalum notatum var. saurae TaxID=547442 RepID=A0AAQ3SXM4_PASNO